MILGSILIVSVWCIICFAIVCACLKKDFNVEFKKLTNIGKKVKEFIFTKVLKYVFLTIPLFFSVLTFWAAYDSRENILQSVILIIVGCIFILPVILLYNFRKEKNTSKKSLINIIQIMGVVLILFGIVSLLAYYGNINIKNKVERSSNCNKYNFSRR